jgi:hypothetical protein
VSSKSRRSPKRSIRPHEQARIDQISAWARNVGAHDPTTAVVTSEYAQPGAACCWCDCTIQAHLAGEPCPGCPDEATTMYHLLCGTPDKKDFPICWDHRDEFMQFVQCYIAGGGPIYATVGRRRLRPRHIRVRAA